MSAFSWHLRCLFYDSLRVWIKATASLSG